MCGPAALQPSLGARLVVLVDHEQRVQVDPNRIRIHDILLTSTEPQTETLTAPPILVVEILSPDDSYFDTQDRARDYLTMGVGMVWVIDPKSRSGRMCKADIWQEARAAGRLADTIIATDVGQHQMWEAQYFRHEDTRTLMTSGGLGTMGFGLPAAIGAKMACPEKDVWVIAGDGGFQMTASELSTIQQDKLHLNIAVINNGFLGMVRQWQEAFYDKNYSNSPILSPNFVKLADAHEIAGVRVTSRAEVIPAVTRARTGNGSFLIDFAVEKEDGVYPMIAPGSALHEMVRRPNPLLETSED